MNILVDGRDVRVSKLDRVLWPSVRMTKADLIAYYTEVAGVLLPHIADHPLALHRFPEGVDGAHFYQIRAPSHPEWVRAYTTRSPTGKTVELVLIDDRPGLVWAANISAIELHLYLGTAASFDAPAQLVIDLDPGPPAGLAACCRVAREVRAVFDTLGLVSVPKTSGGKGIHVHVPLDGATFDETKAFAHAIALLVADRLPELVVTTIAKPKRKGRVYVDWVQNDAWRSLVAPWSLRGFTYPTVAMPLLWDEVERVADSSDPSSLIFMPADVPARLDAVGDPAAVLHDARQRIPAPFMPTS